MPVAVKSGMKKDLLFFKRFVRKKNSSENSRTAVSKAGNYYALKSMLPCGHFPQSAIGYCDKRF